jgi:hypothetical protein
MDRARYIDAITDSPWAFPAVDGLDSPPSEWAAAAWETAAVQDTVAEEMRRDVSKVGSVMRDTSSLARISDVLRTEQVVRLFEAIRADSPHREAEFRPQFERAFARHAASLPPPLTRAQIMEILQLDEEEARQLLDGDGDAQWDEKNPPEFTGDDIPM